MPSGLSGKVISYECWNYDRASDPALCCGHGGKENGKGQKGRQDMRKLRRKLQLLSWNRKTKVNTHAIG